MDGFTVRRAGPRDLTRIKAMLRDAGLPSEEVRDALSALDDPSCCAYVAVAGGEGGMAGLGTLSVEAGADGSRVGTVGHLVVPDHWRGLGVGAAVLEALLEEASSRRCGQVRVATRHGPGP